VSWLADQPRPREVEDWQLAVGGAVKRSLLLPYGALTRGERLVATLDCTGGFYSTQVWHGTHVGALLEQAGVSADAAYVSFVSVTGYRCREPRRYANDGSIRWCGGAWQVAVERHIG